MQIYLYKCVLNGLMATGKGKIVRKGTDGKGKPRKFIEVRGVDYDEFEFGDIVKYENNLYRSDGVCSGGLQVSFTNGKKIIYKSSKKVKRIFHKKTLFVYHEIMKFEDRNQ